MSEQLLTYRDVAWLTGLSESTLRAYRAQGRLPEPDASPVPDRPRWHLETITRWQSRRPGRGAPGRPRARKPRVWVSGAAWSAALDPEADPTLAHLPAPTVRSRAGRLELGYPADPALLAEVAAALAAAGRETEAARVRAATTPIRKG